MASERLLHSDRCAEALEILLDGVARPSPTFSSYLIETARRCGGYAQILEFLSSKPHGLGPVVTAVARYDALVATGQFDEASGTIERIAQRHMRDFRVFTRLRDDRLRHGTSLVELRRTAEAALRNPSLTHDEVDFLAAFFFELHDLDNVDRVVATSEDQSALGETALYNVAKSHYVQRRFDQALTAIELLRGSSRSWQAEKLESRIIFEVGDFESSLAARRSSASVNEELDEVEYHSLLQLGRFAEAFSLYFSTSDRRRFRNAFADRVEDGAQPLRHVGRRFVVPQGGPGDEILHAALYPTLASLSDHLTVACEPRLQSLLERSFPTIEFVPTPRAMARSIVAGSEQRCSLLHDLLDDRARVLAKSADSIVPGRALPAVSLALRAAPYQPSLVPDPELTNDLRARRRGRFTVGLVWRSEFNSAMRSIHYLNAEELGPLSALDVDFLCLQHDATHEEIETLRELTSDRFSSPDGMNLRDDFESAAATVASLDAVVGVGTTMVELAASVGTAAVSMQPTHFSSWRAHRHRSGDFWHQGLRIAAVRHPLDRSHCVREAVRLVREIREESRAPSSELRDQ